MQLMNIEECVSIMIFADCEPHGIICNTSFRWHGASEQSGALSFYPTPTVPGFLFSETNNKLITYEL